MPVGLERWMRRLRNRLFVGEALHLAAGYLAVFLFCWGTVLLSAKLFFPAWWRETLWLGLGIVPLLGFVLWQASRQLPSGRETVAWLDKRLALGGLLMTITERPDAAWQSRLPSDETIWRNALPKVRPTRFLRMLAVPVLFFIGAGMLPARPVTPPAPPTAAGTDAAAELAETFALLEEASALEEEQKELLRDELEKLAEEAENNPLTHEKWETLDALREQLRSGFEATETSVSQGQSAAAALAGALANGEPLSMERTEQLTADLKEALETLRKNGALQAAGTAARVGLPEELQRLMKSGNFQLPSDPAARKQMLDGLQKLLDAEAKKLCEARGKCQNCLVGQCKGGQCEGGQCNATLATNQPGRGGITRGRGDAELTFGEESDESAVKFKETVLPPGFLDQPSDSVLGVSAHAPEVDPAAPAARTAAREASAATGKTTWQRPLRPRHREAVRGYFGE